MMNIEHDADKVLRDLICHAEVAAKHSMERTGTFPPTIFIDGVEGRVTYSPPVKFLRVCLDDLAEIARECSVAYGATAIVVAGEAWKVRIPHQRDMSAPSDDFANPIDREEILTFIGETRYEKLTRIRRIIRSGDGHLLGMGEGVHINDPGLFEHYADMLPSEFPDAECREVVKAELHKDGHRIKEDRKKILGFYR